MRVLVVVTIAAMLGTWEVSAATLYSPPGIYGQFVMCGIRNVGKIVGTAVIRILNNDKELFSASHPLLPNRTWVDQSGTRFRTDGLACVFETSTDSENWRAYICTAVKLEEPVSWTCFEAR